MCERAYIEGQHRAQSAKRKAGKLPSSLRLRFPDESPGLDDQNRHERGIENQPEQSPPHRNLNRCRMKVTGRKSAFVVEPQAALEFRLTAFADTNQRIVFYDTECLAPNFKPISGTAFVGIEKRNAARVLDR